MNRIRLTHLTFVGRAVESASVEFGPGLTVVRGPSDTGKSFIADSIDFILGAKALKEIPERAGYSSVLLGLELPDGSPVTLARSVNGGSIGLHASDVRSAPLSEPTTILSSRHDARSESNLSRYLLSLIGLDGAKVRRNARNETDSLSFRNLVHLCLIDETQMQSEVPPALTGHYVSKTKEISVLKLLLEDEDDAALVAVDSKEQVGRLSGAKIEVIDRLLGEVEVQLAGASAIEEIRAQLVRLNGSIELESQNFSALTSRRDQAAELLHRSRQMETTRRTKLGDTVALRERFRLLLAQYDSDFARLEMIREAGSLLGYFQRGVCVFCGADPEHQRTTQECVGNATDFESSLEVERRNTQALREDLVTTMRDLDQRVAELQIGIAEANQSASVSARDLMELDRQVRPRHADIGALIDLRSSLERLLALYEQAASLELMKVQVANEARPDVAAAATGLSLHAVRELSQEISQRLSDWGFPDAQAVRYDRLEQDVVAGDQLRSAHGKGVRAILHAAFTLGLAQYCFDRDIPHPGFAILDSPLVTYRPPDSSGAGGVSAEGLPDGIVGAFYADVQRRFDGQVIVLENTNPPQVLQEESVDLAFTKRADLGRYGFFPVDSLS